MANEGLPRGTEALELLPYETEQLFRAGELQHEVEPRRRVVKTHRRQL